MLVVVQLLAQLLAAATAVQMGFALVLRYRSGRQNVREAVRLAAGLATFLISGWLACFSSEERGLVPTLLAAAVLALANAVFWAALHPHREPRLTALLKRNVPSALAALRPGTIATHPAYLAYLLGLLGLALLGHHSIQYIFGALLLFVFDAIIRAEERNSPPSVSLPEEYRLSVYWEWKSFAQPVVVRLWRAAIARVAKLGRWTPLRRCRASWRSWRIARTLEQGG
jgi:hypothetical protein